MEAFSMKALILFLTHLALVFALSSFGHADNSTFAAREKATFDACIQEAKTHMDENLCASQAFKRVDKKLNDMYKELITQKRKDPEYRRFVENLKKTQRTWLLFVNSHISNIYPEGAGAHGSYEPFCEILARTSMTMQRIEQLSAFFDSDADNVCGGFKINEK
jgi:uncharacterized protein YecT (DUF1311 family)